MENSLVPFDQLERMAAVMGANGMFGKKAADLLPLMLIAQAEGKHPAIAAMEFDIIQGRPAINSKSALARFQASGGRIQYGKHSDTDVTATFEHASGGSLDVTWTIKRAEQAGLTGKENWRKYPEQMLRSRVISEGVRAVYPACLSGLYTDDEVRDMPPLPLMRNVTPKAPAIEQEGTATASGGRRAEILQVFEDFIASGEITVEQATFLRGVIDNPKVKLEKLEEILAKITTAQASE